MKTVAFQRDGDVGIALVTVYSEEILATREHGEPVRKGAQLVLTWVNDRGERVKRTIWTTKERGLQAIETGR